MFFSTRKNVSKTFFVERSPKVWKEIDLHPLTSRNFIQHQFHCVTCRDLRLSRDKLTLRSWRWFWTSHCDNAQRYNYHNNSRKPLEILIGNTFVCLSWHAECFPVFFCLTSLGLFNSLHKFKGVTQNEKTEHLSVRSINCFILNVSLTYVAI